MPDPGWRPMRPADLAAVEAIALTVHTDYPEDEAVFAERLRLYPAGCHVLETPAGIGGYVISHPWRLGVPPPLNTLITTVPEDADTWFIHDLALHKAVRGTGAASCIVASLAALTAASGIITLSLIAVGGSVPFWGRQGFRPAELAVGKLDSYGVGSQYMIRSFQKKYLPP